MKRAFLVVNEFPLGEFNDVKIQESQLVLRNCEIQNYKLLSWLQSDPLEYHDIDLDIEDEYSSHAYMVVDGRIQRFEVKDNLVQKVIIEFNDIIELDKKG